ncbi:MAG: uncharacterized protein KVP18_002334 [Porospora cf. gigantea A]|uniref:uncharacterized protein n=2 Tax=Porospora cf. gigantea A TaxID=2853593 RepID=UPI0035593EFC|nr:MAG: hypothetical protein KVP18_002334 [Porospora cf. gigantea A]
MRWLLGLLSVSAQILQYDRVPVPDSYRFRNTGKFFSFSPQDNNAKWLEWFGLEAKPPVVVYDQIHLDTESRARWGNYPGLHIQLVPLNVYEDVIAPVMDQGLDSTFCCTLADVTSGVCKHAGYVRYPENRDLNYGYKIAPMSPPERVAGAIARQSVFQTLIINCHTKTSPGFISGNVILRGPYGYISAVELPKLLLYGVSAAGFLLLMLAWAGQMARYRKQVTRIHQLFLAVILISLMESLFWSAHYHYWNNVGYISIPLNVLAVGCTVIRISSLLVLMLVLGMGWGVTKHRLDRGTKLRVRFLWCLIVGAEIARQWVTEVHYSRDISDLVTVLAALPAALLYAVTIVWTLLSLGTLLGQLRRTQQTAKYSHFSRFACVLGTSGVFMICVIALQYWVILFLSLEKRWTFEWFFTAGCDQILHFFVLSMTAFIWRPTRLSKQLQFAVQLTDLTDIPRPKNIYEDMKLQLQEEARLDDEDELDRILDSEEVTAERRVV